MVTITVSAGPNQGKTTIARIIEDALRERGFSNVKVVDLAESAIHKIPAAQRFEAAKKREVIIKVENVGDQEPRLTNERASL